MRARSSRSSRATAWNFVRTAGVTRPRRAAASTSRAVRASTENDVAAVVDASLLPRGGRASARLALAWSSHRLLLWNAGHGGHGSMPHSPAAGRVTSRAQGLVLRTPSRLADLQGSTQRASISATCSPGAAGRWAGDHGTGKVVVGRPARFLGTVHVTRARAHNSRPHSGRGHPGIIARARIAPLLASRAWLRRRWRYPGRGRR